MYVAATINTNGRENPLVAQAAKIGLEQYMQETEQEKAAKQKATVTGRIEGERPPAIVTNYASFEGWTGAFKKQSDLSVKPSVPKHLLKTLDDDDDLPRPEPDVVT